MLWEILCRDDPYQDRQFGWIDEVSTAVREGVRPTIPPSSPQLYVKLMKECWANDSDSRPTFAHIVNRLASMADQTLTELSCQLDDSQGKATQTSRV